MNSKRITKAMIIGPVMVAACLLVSWPALASNAPDDIPQFIIEYDLFSGVYSGVGVEYDQSVEDSVSYLGVPWLRIYFGECNLGESSSLILTSLEDGSQQFLNAKTLAEWNYSSAYFNGDTVDVELVIAAGDEDIFYTVSAMTVGEWAEGADGGIETLCGGDSRVNSTDNRAGRIGGCSAWLISNGFVLTAGHCTDVDPDQGGPGLPDGVLDLSGVMEFNVPDSDSNGTLNFSNANDQYPINTANVTWRFDGSGQGLGKDWSVFEIFNNSNTGTDAHVRFGFFRPTRANPQTDVDITRITGFGIDDTPAGTSGGRNSDNRTNQTSTGLYRGESTGNVAADIFHQYSTDTEPANSGSPVIWDDDISNGSFPGNTFTIGIHTNGGCQPNGTGSNSGTSFEVNALQDAMHAFPAGSNEEYVDAITTHPGFESGNVLEPWDTVAEGVSNVLSGGQLIIVEGTYVIPATVNMGTDGKNFTVTAPVGTVTIW
jgi:hypothetical protein